MVQLRVRDLMTTQVITVKPTDTVRQAVIKMALDNVTGSYRQRREIYGHCPQAPCL